MAKFINPFTDVGFKRIFGQEVSKPLLIDFLNNLLEREHKIVDLHFLDKEQVAEVEEDRSLIYDVYCEAENGEKFIVEMQNKRQDYFIDRSVYYLSQAISRQGQRGARWHYNLTPVYFIALLNFKMQELRPSLKVVSHFTDGFGNQVSDKATMIFLQLPYFQKSADECENDFERWIFLLKNMDMLQRMPAAFQSSVFTRLAEIADLSSMNREERAQYDRALKRYRDTLSVYETTFQDGRKAGWDEGREKGLLEGREKGLLEGREIGLFESARKMKELGLPIETIMEVTGLTAEQINDL